MENLMNFNYVLAQLNFTVGDIEHNAAIILKACYDAKIKHSADMVIFPELALSGYPPEDLLLRKDFLEKIHSGLLSIQENLPENLAVIMGYPELGVYNSAVVMTKEKIIANYRKQILPNYGVFDEKRYFKPGNDDGVFVYRGLKIGLLICEDAWASEPCRNAKTAGAEILIVINASPFEADKLSIRLDMIKARVAETKLPMMYLNHCGVQDDLVFDGSSFVVDSQGKVLCEAPFGEECLLAVDASKPCSKKNQLGSNFYNLNAQDKAAQIMQALVMSVRDYVRKNHFEKVVIGLSGGIDSALTLAIAVDALGKDNVLPIMIPSRFTSSLSMTAAKIQLKNLQLNYEEISLEPMLEESLSSLKLSVDDKNKNIILTIQNIQARIRGLILMARANQGDYLLLNTSNKSEIAVGYGTLYGDMCGAYAVLKDLWKTDVYRIARYRNQCSAVIPEEILSRAPSAELWHGQLDSDHLPPYEILDEILKLYIEHQKSPEEITQAGFGRELVKKVLKLVVQNEYKRKQAPLGPRVSSMAFTRERRYPISSGFF